MSTAIPNWNLGERKRIKEAEPKLAKYSEQLAAKLGAGWKFDVDWATAGANAEGSYRAKPDESVVDYLIGGILSHDVAKFDPMTVAGLNSAVGTNKTITITIGPKTDTYVYRRANISIDGNGVKIVFNADNFGCSWDENWLTQAANKLPNTTAPPGVSAGEFNLGELKNIASKRDLETKAEEAVRAKLGSGWTLMVDWASVDKYSRDHDNRHRIGDMVLDYIITSFVKCDLNKMDADITEALNEKVGKAKTLRFALGPKDGKYEQYRCNVVVDDKSGITVTVNSAYLQCCYEENNVCKWALKNC